MPAAEGAGTEKRTVGAGGSNYSGAQCGVRWALVCRRSPGLAANPDFCLLERRIPGLLRCESGEVPSSREPTDF
jgi:hypothetical protein